MAKDFFLKLVCKKPDSRYDASQALTHPWITRKLESIIPLTFEQKIHNFNKEHDVVNVKFYFFWAEFEKIYFFIYVVLTIIIFDLYFSSEKMKYSQQ